MASSKPVRAAVIGAGVMGFWHARALARAGATLALVIDRDLERARGLAARYRGCAAADRIAQLAPHTIDAVHVCTPTSTHVTIIEAALAANCHVLAEKPLAEDESTTRTLLGLAAMHKRLLCPVHQVLYQRGVDRALATLDRIQPLHCDLTMCSAGAEGRVDGDDDLVAEILPHPLSFLVRALPDAARSTQWSVASAAAGELRGTLNWSNGTASILISSHGRPTVNGARITGARGTIHFDFFHGFAVAQDPAVSRTRKASQPFLYSARLAVAATGNLAARAVRGQSAYPGLWELVAAFYRAIEHDLASPIAAAETIQVAALRDLILSRPPLETRRRGFTSVHPSTSMQER